MTTFPIPPDGADHVLVASPSSVVRQKVLESLRPKVTRVEQAKGGAEALVHLEKGSWQLLLLDRRLPDLDAEELSATVRERYPSVEVVLLDNDTDASPWKRIDASTISAAWPYGADEGVAETDRNGADQQWQQAGIRQDLPLEKCDRFAGAPALPGMVGASRVMQSVYRLTRLVAPRDTTVLITGPTGSGKELIARAVHELSGRATRAFTVVNCAAIPETMLEAELFGYSRGSFTGALQSYAGRIQSAHQGTLFLDEIGDMPLSLQPKLLRFLEQKELQRLGSAQVVRVDARVLAATNVDLLTLVRQGKFREDLYYRLAAFPLAIPPLCDRPEDVVQLAQYFLEKFSIRPPVPVLSEDARSRLQAQNWPGNVRELQNAIERALILANGDLVIRAIHLKLDSAG
jgi:DNA-binding NtrC family response regulator